MIYVSIGFCNFYQGKVQVKARKFIGTCDTCLAIECTSCRNKRKVLDAILRMLQNSHITLLLIHSLLDGSSLKALAST